jgi:transcriptional regulator with XRE-family HTH domain|nr:MAG TPA: helix-turn-helix domain protein [Caudoviricetes sp.]
MTVEQELRALRELHHMTQVQLADKAGVSVTTIRKMERGERVKVDVLELIAEALGKKVKVILE